MRLIGLCGAAGAGKDTAAAFLVADGWTRIAFADALKAVLYDMDVWITDEDGEPEGLNGLIDVAGWDYAKNRRPEVRGLLQRLGVAVRDHVSEDAWLDAAARKMDPSDPNGKFVVSDVRFKNEIWEIQSLGGVLVRIDRPMGSAILSDADVNRHISETAWRGAKFDHVITNDGSLESLAEQIRAIGASL